MQMIKIRNSDLLRARLVMAVVALEFCIPDMPLHYKKGGNSRLIFARQIAMYLTHTVYQINYARVARTYKRDPSTVGHACRVIEDCRDDPMLDAQISKLEALLDMAPVPAPELDKIDGAQL